LGAICPVLTKHTINCHLSLLNADLSLVVAGPESLWQFIVVLGMIPKAVWEIFVFFEKSLPPFCVCDLQIGLAV
jgi:hypothetical protein